MPQPEDVDVPRTGQTRVEPRTEVERLIADVWAEVLGPDQIGVHDDFFELGGQSLHVTRVINQVQLLTGLDVDVLAFFEAPTVAGLADHVVERFAALQPSEGGPAGATA